MKDISKRIKELREERNISQAELAEKLFVTRQAISNWETQKTRPDIETLEAMSKIFEIDIMEFLYGNEVDEAERKRKLVQIYFFGGCTVLAVIMQILVLPWLQDINSRYYNMGFTLFICGIITQFLFCGAVPFLLSLLGLKNDIYIKNRTVRKAVLYIGIALASICLLAFILVFFNIGQNRLLAKIWFFAYWLTVNGSKIYLPVIIGALLYLGIKKEKQG